VQVRLSYRLAATVLSWLVVLASSPASRDAEILARVAERILE
jgi:hypothetical protein